MPVKPLPVIVKATPPAVVPALGVTLVNVGAGPAATKVKWSAGVIGLVPTGVTTVTSTTPSDSAGVVTKDRCIGLDEHIGTGHRSEVHGGGPRESGAGNADDRSTGVQSGGRVHAGDAGAGGGGRRYRDGQG